MRSSKMGNLQVQNGLVIICVTPPRLYTYMSGQKLQAVEGTDLNGTLPYVPNTFSSSNSPIQTHPVLPCSPPLCKNLWRNAPMIHGSPIIPPDFTGMAAIQQDVCALFLAA
jgi:hypothetical protein